MITFKKFLTEKSDDDILDSERLSEEVKKFIADCSDYFDIMTPSVAGKYDHLVLYRGQRNWPSQFVNSSYSFKTKPLIEMTRNVQAGRSPSDTPLSIHDAFNKIMKKYLGYPFRDGVMCTGSKNQAEEYGTTHIIVPVNGWTMAYAKNVHDAYEDMFSNITPNGSSEQRLHQKLMAEFEEGKFVAGKQHIAEAISYRNEIMLYPTNSKTLIFYVFEEPFWKSITPEIIKQLS